MASSWLGFKDVAVAEADDDEPVSCTDSFMGGIPIFPSCSNFDLKAKFDADEMCCLMQLYCPLDSHSDMHRSILVLMPSQPPNTLSPKSFKIFRFQWSAMKSISSGKKDEQEKSKSTVNATQSMFTECDNWGDGENGDGSCWGQPPSKKKNPEPKSESKTTTETGTEKHNLSENSEMIKFKQRFEPYFLTFDAEDLSESSIAKDDRMSELMREYKEAKSNQNDSSGLDDDNDSLDSNELLDMARKGTGATKCVSSPEDDEVFRKFHHRISSDPSQILRFGGKGEYLPVYNSKISYPKPCSACGAHLGCELQILPSFISCISEIESESRQSSLPEIPLFSLGVFTCANTSNCSKFDEPCLQIEDVVFEVEK